MVAFCGSALGELSLKIRLKYPIQAVVSYGVVIYVLTLKTFWIVMLVVPGTDYNVISLLKKLLMQ